MARKPLWTMITLSVIAAGVTVALVGLCAVAARDGHVATAIALGIAALIVLAGGAWADTIAKRRLWSR